MKVTIRRSKIDEGASIIMYEVEEFCCDLMKAQLEDVRELPELWKYCPFSGHEIKRIEAES